MRPSADAKRIRLAFELDPGLGPVVADPERLQQVMWNLLSNAIKFTPAGGDVVVEAHRRGSRAEICVRDTGQGIAPDFLPYVFEAFRQQDASSSRRHGGLGLGLAIVRHLVELHGGRVRAESDGLDRGAIFTFDLPLAPADVGVSAPDHAAADSGRATGALDGIRILLVEDEPDSREMLAELFRTLGAEVYEAATACEGYRLLSHRPDVLVSDIEMPDEDGYSLLRRVRELPPAMG